MKQRGFTLLEVLVALAVLALSLAATIKAAGSSAGNMAYLRERTVAGWVAENIINEILLSRDWPGIGERSGTALMAGREWRWTVKVSSTDDADLRRLDVAVGVTATPVTTLAAFMSRP